MFDKYYQKSWSERLKILLENNYLNNDEIKYIKNSVFNSQLDNTMIENFITEYHIPEGLAFNYIIDGKEYIIPMVTEEPSVIAAASNGGRLIKAGGGFHVLDSNRLLLGQVIIQNIKKMNETIKIINDNKKNIINVANESHPSIIKYGGGMRWIKTRILDKNMLSLDIAVDVRKAMGANIMNTMLESIAQYLKSNHHQNVLMSIMTNYATESLVRIRAKVPFDILKKHNVSGKKIAEKIQKASYLAHIDPYRAATNNKGIMNGIDAVVIASGNDWRAIEAGVHACAVVNGQYRGLSDWYVSDKELIGELSLPMPVGIVGGSINIVPLVKINHKLLQIKSAKQLAEVITCVGLGQNLAALYALVTDGIQKGHMHLQLKSLALSIGANHNEVDKLVNLLEKLNIRDSKNARIILNKIRKKS